MQRTILIFAYYSYNDPVFQSAVLPYFIKFPNSEKYRFILQTFEQKKYKHSIEDKKKITSYLKKHNIIWYSSNWHSGPFKPIKKIFDLIFAVIKSSFLIYKYKVKIVYSEGFPGAILGHIVCKINSKAHIVHSFEPHADYMIEAGVWKENSWESKVQRYFELNVGKNANYILSGTNAYIQLLKSKGITTTFLRVPSCVDTGEFYHNPHERQIVRKLHHISDKEIVVTYLGKFRGMYFDEEELISFFSVLSESKKRRYKFFILTVDDIEVLNKTIESSTLNKSRVIIKRLQRHEIRAYLSASDFGLVAVKQYHSKLYCSPIKTGEYLACGLPVIIPKRVSDDYEILQKDSIAILLEAVDNPSFLSARYKLDNYVSENNRIEIVKKCRAYIRKDRDINKYKIKYEKIFSKSLRLFELK